MKLLMIVIVSGGYMLESIDVPDNKSCEQVYDEQVEIVPNPKYTEGNGENWVIIKWGDKKVIGYFCNESKS